MLRIGLPTHWLVLAFFLLFHGSGYSQNTEVDNASLGPNAVEPILVQFIQEPYTVKDKLNVKLSFSPTHCLSCKHFADIDANTAIINDKGGAVALADLNTTTVYTAESLTFSQSSNTLLTKLVLLSDRDQ